MPLTLHYLTHCIVDEAELSSSLNFSDAREKSLMHSYFRTFFFHEIYRFKDGPLILLS